MKGRFLPLLVAGLVLASSTVGMPADRAREAPVVTASRIPLYADNPMERRAGQLVYRGGLVLRSGRREFGGWSDLAVSADGSELLAISDQGHWLGAHLSYDPNGDLAGISDGEIAPMLDAAGRPLRGLESDSEGLTLERAGDVHGTVAVSFEHHVRISRYDLSKGFGARPTNVPIGNWVDVLHTNKQLEAVTLWHPDTLIAFAEAKVNPGDDLLAAMEAYPNEGGEPMTRMLSVVPHDPFAITSVANAPDGGLYLLERRFSLLGGMGMELRHIPADEIRPGARLNGEVIANLSYQNANIDNMEGLALRRGPKGEIFLYMISDDNYLPIQRTLLLMFEVRGGN